MIADAPRVETPQVRHSCQLGGKEDLTWDIWVIVAHPLNAQMMRFRYMYLTKKTFMVLHVLKVV